MKWVRRIPRFLLAGIFLWAGVAKLMNPWAFADRVADFQFFPEILVNGIAIVVPVVELAAAGLLLSWRWTRQGALLSILLTLGFAVLFGWAAMHGRPVQCSCFGGGEFFGTSAMVGLVRALILLGLGACFIGPKGRRPASD